MICVGRGAVLALSAAVFIASCGGDDEAGDSKDRPSGDRSGETSIQGSGAELRRCAERWNASVAAARPDTAQGHVAARARARPDTLAATITLYGGARIADRRGPCVVVVKERSIVYAPFSPVKGSRAWASLCRLVGAKPDADNPRNCSRYTTPLAASANARFTSEAELRLTGAS